MEELISTYRQFLKELHKASAGARFSHELDLLLLDLDGKTVEECAKGSFSSFIHFFDSLVDKTRHGITNWDGICNIMAKKGSTKAAKLFFLNDHTITQDLTLNVGSLALEQTKHNSTQIRNFIYMCYCQVCKFLIDDGEYAVHESTMTNYAAVCKLFEQEENEVAAEGAESGSSSGLPGGIPDLGDFMKNPSGLVDMYIKMLDELVAKGLNGAKLCQMVLDNDNPIVTALIGSAFGNMLDVDSVRSQVEKLDEDDIKAILDQVKLKLKDLDLVSLLNSVQSMNPSDMQSVMSNLQDSFTTKPQSS